MSDEIWILGGTGRSGRATAGELAAAGVPVVLVGRDATRLTEASARMRDARVVVADSVASMIAEIRRQRPAVVVNTVGPFAATAAPLARACLPVSSYVDLGNDFVATSAVLSLHEQAVAAGRALVTGAGFGVLATESVVMTLCEGRSAPERVRTDAVPSVAIEAGVLGEALAATIVDGVPEGGRRYEQGRLVRARVGGEQQRLTLPDGSRVTTSSIPLGELVAAQRASGAPSVVSASSEVPSSPLVQAVLPLGSALLSIGPLRTLARRRLARVRFGDRPRPRDHSWGRADVRWADGTGRTGWLRTGDASAFTAAVLAEVAHRLLRGGGRPGAYTPAALFGPSLAEACGGQFLLDVQPDHIERD